MHDHAHVYVHIDEHTDIDILTDNYYRLKAIIGGKQYKSNPVERCGGYKVANHVQVNGKLVSFDIRTYCDNYYPVSWMRNMISTKKKDKRGFYRMNDENFMYSLIIFV